MARRDRTLHGFQNLDSWVLLDDIFDTPEKGYSKVEYSDGGVCPGLQDEK